MSRRRPWTDDELGFLQSPPRGWTNADIAEHLGRSTPTVRNYRRRLRDGWSPEPRHYTEEFLQAVVESVDRVVADVADELNCSTNSVKGARRYLRDIGALSADSRRRWVRPERPYEVGDRSLLAKTCVDCGLLWSGVHFPRTKGHGFGSSCYRCKNKRYRKPESRTAAAQAAYVAAMEAATEALSTPDVPYRSNHREPWMEPAVKMLARQDLTLPQIAATLGRSWSAVSAACHAYGVTRPIERATQLPTGQWRIDFAREDTAA